METCQYGIMIDGLFVPNDSIINQNMIPSFYPIHHYAELYYNSNNHVGLFMQSIVPYVPPSDAKTEQCCVITEASNDCLKRECDEHLLAIAQSKKSSKTEMRKLAKKESTTKMIDFYMRKIFGRHVEPFVYALKESTKSKSVVFSGVLDSEKDILEALQRSDKIFASGDQLNGFLLLMKLMKKEIPNKEQKEALQVVKNRMDSDNEFETKKLLVLINFSNRENSIVHSYFIKLQEAL